VSRSTQAAREATAAPVTTPVPTPVPGPSAAGAERALRADARRNREALLSAGAVVFADRGPDASLEDIARQAGVGIGTLYRHFPDRDALTEAVYRREVERLCDGVATLLGEHPADVALATWMRDFASYAATKRGMMVALKSALPADSDLFTDSHRRMREAIETLVAAATAEGSIRGDIDSEALLAGMRGICMATSAPADARQTSLLIDLLVDGLRFRAPARS
jgi:AcrR family transcriptional regulator